MNARSDAWRWAVCALLLLATMLLYMDRQTLSLLARAIQREFGIDDGQYGELEMGFGLAFAVGSLVFGFLADRLGPRWLYPFVLIGWSLAGCATAFAPTVGTLLADLLGLTDLAPAATTYRGFLACRVTLGFFEAGHWPCAVITTQAILTRKDRSFGNSLLQSGASLGAILTPLVVLRLLPNEDPLPAGAWRSPFLVIGVIGMAWAVPWLALVRSRDLVGDAAPAAPATERLPPALPAPVWWSRFLALVVVVVTINLTWQFFRAWLPKFLEEKRGYDRDAVLWFISAYYIATDVGCIAVGIAVKLLASRGTDVHRARMATYAVCVGLTLLSLVVAVLPAGPLLLLLLLLMGAGTLGLFPNYYSFTQELASARLGKLSGFLGAFTWVASALMQKAAGDWILETHSYTEAIVLAGLVPLLGFAAMLLLWRRAP